MVWSVELDNPVLYLDAASVPDHDVRLNGPAATPPTTGTPGHDEGTLAWDGVYGTYIEAWDSSTYGRSYTGPGTPNESWYLQLPIPINAQDETSYDNSPTTEGTFSGGSGHASPDVITLSDGTDITVDAVDGGGGVTQFTVDSSSSTGAAPGDTLTQSSTTGSGINFDLTPDEDNIEDANALPDGWYVVQVRIS